MVGERSQLTPTLTLNQSVSLADRLEFGQARCFRVIFPIYIHIRLQSRRKTCVKLHVPIDTNDWFTFSLATLKLNFAQFADMSTGGPYKSTDVSRLGTEYLNSAASSRTRNWCDMMIHGSTDFQFMNRLQATLSLKIQRPLSNPELSVTAQICDHQLAAARNLFLSFPFSYLYNQHLQNPSKILI